LFGDGTNFLNNTGQIRGDTYGIYLNGLTGEAPRIVNAGTIIGQLQGAIIAENGHRLNVTNSGTLAGHVEGRSADQADRVINNGTIRGDVKLGSGIDVYQGNGLVTGTVSGEAGNDTLTGGRSADRLNGGDGNDKLFGALGNDNLTAG
jgi:Ca2+-binding RTX toxin-like protein